MMGRAIAIALGGHRTGEGWMARCPSHPDRQPSLSIRDADDGKVLVHCHAGCDKKRVIETLRARGLWPGNSPNLCKGSAPRAGATIMPSCDAARRTEAALAIWHASMPVEGTLVEIYLAGRELHLPPPPTLRFHGGLKHPSGGIWPALVALVTRGPDGVPLAIHRTFLARNGARKAPVEPQKMMLGPCHGGAVQLARAGDVLMVGADL
jgi:putative DNA primase/helicase